LFPQDAAPASWQVPCGSDAPTRTFAQVPSDVVSAHDWQAPEHALLQQIPCAQKPLAHSGAVEQEAPLLLGPHEFVLLQLLGDLH
jgi:hypothetical protein